MTSQYYAFLHFHELIFFYYTCIPFHVKFNENSIDFPHNLSKFVYVVTTFVFSICYKIVLRLFRAFPEINVWGCRKALLFFTLVGIVIIYILCRVGLWFWKFDAWWVKNKSAFRHPHTFISGKALNNRRTIL
jgi:hypothetical protein